MENKNLDSGKMIQDIREKVKNKKALCALSGGLDSSVAALLTHKAIGDNLTCVFVDHGLLRKGEAREVVETFSKTFKMNLVAVDASKRFMSRLKGIIDPEEKRKIIGSEFIEVFKDEAEKIEQVDFLVQGTVYSDIVESGADNSGHVKSHHNVGGLPKDLGFELLEPLRNLYKDEVRALAKTIGLPETIVYRQAFPGPGLAIRVLGEVTSEKVEILRDADFIVTDEIKKAGLEKKLWQFFAVLPDVKSTGVTEGVRTYTHTVAVRAVESREAMAARWAHLPYGVLEKISSRITDEVPGVNRVVYDITSKPPATIEWE